MGVGPRGWLWPLVALLAVRRSGLWALGRSRLRVGSPRVCHRSARGAGPDSTEAWVTVFRSGSRDVGPAAHPSGASQGGQGGHHRSGSPQELAHRDSGGPGSNKTEGSVKAPASKIGYRALLRWAERFPERRWAVENARGLTAVHLRRSGTAVMEAGNGGAEHRPAGSPCCLTTPDAAGCRLGLCTWCAPGAKRPAEAGPKTCAEQGKRRGRSRTRTGDLHRVKVAL